MSAGKLREIELLARRIEKRNAEQQQDLAEMRGLLAAAGIEVGEAWTTAQPRSTPAAPGVATVAAAVVEAIQDEGLQRLKLRSNGKAAIVFADDAGQIRTGTE